MTVQRGALAGVAYNWQWANESALELVIPGAPGLMARILRDYESHGGKWARAFNFPYFWEGKSIGHTRKGTYVAPLSTPTRPRPRLYSVGGKVRVSPNPTPQPQADWELEAGPLLVLDGKATDIASLEKAGDFRGIDPSVKRDRVGLGYKNGKVVHIVSHTVATLHDVQAAALELGCEWCIAGDGGRSVTLHQRGESPVSRAYDERPLPAVLVFKAVAEAPEPTAPAQPQGGLPLRQGDRGPLVRELQELLIRAGYLEPGSTDYFGPLTHAGVQAFQRAFGLPADGIVTAIVWAALQAALPVPQPTVYTDVQKWLREVVIPGAKALEAAHGVPWQFSAAQADLESWTGSGPSGLARDCHNLFGVKHRTGPYREYQTWEHVDGRDVTVMAKFQVYASVEACFLDRAELLTNSRYSPALKWRDNWAAYAAAIHRAGYATDPWYTYNLISRAYAHGIPALG